jgi:hypothetical protein
MAYSLTWLPEVLEDAGLKVAEQPGWRTRGRGEVGRIRGVMCHHTAGSRHGNMPSLALLTRGRADLPGPLAQLGLGRDGTFYVISAGRANHAGRGNWQGVTTGNSSFIGIEAENSGRNDDPWPAVQLDAYRRGAAAILRKVNAAATMCCGHREYALPSGRKSDPMFSMDEFRSGVAAILAGQAAIPPPIPAMDQSARPTLAAWPSRPRGGHAAAEAGRRRGRYLRGHHRSACPRIPAEISLGPRRHRGAEKLGRSRRRLTSESFSLNILAARRRIAPLPVRRPAPISRLPALTCRAPQSTNRT